MIKKRMLILLTYIMVFMGIVGVHVEVDAAESLSEQIKQAASGATIKLDKDYTEEVTIPEGANVTLDLNGHRITSDTYKVIANWGTLKIIDSAGGGIIERKSGDVEGENNIRCIMNEPNAVLTLEGISLHTNVTDGDPISIGIHNKGLITKISNCNIKAETIGTKWAYGIWNEGTIDDISDGWFYGALLADHQNGNDSFAIYNNKGTVNISGGIFIGITRGSGYGYGICSAGTGTANLSGGSFYADNGQCYKIINNNTFFEQAVATRDQGTINYKNNTSLTSNTDGARVVLGENQHYITFVDETELPMATYVMDNNGNIVKRMGKVQNRYNVYIKNKTEVVTESDLSRYGSNTILYMNTGDQREAIYFLGSSVTQGTNCWNNSYADYLGDQYGDQVIIRKRALSGTPIADRDPWSYVKRMEKDINPNAKVDHLIVQLSTNDAGWANSPIGSVADANVFSKSALNANRDTVVGAIEYITAYAQETWGCRVTFWPGPEYNSTKYKEMRTALVEKVYPKWKDHGMGILDFWTLWKPVDGDINPDGVHPYKQGYLKMVPYTYDYLKEFDAKVVSDCINQIGSVTEEGSCGERIAEARYLYDNLLKDAKQNVSNYQTLVDAETKYASYFEGTRKIDNATEVYALSGPAGGQNENYTELFDGKIATKSGTGNHKTTPYIWKVSSPVAIKYYKLTTANDSFTWKGRNPKGWKLYGSNDYDEKGNGTWTEIDSVSGDTYLKDENYYEVLYKVNNPQRYSYYKWELPSESVDFLQMAEFTMYEDVNVPIEESDSLMAKIVSADAGATIKLDKDYTEEIRIAEGIDVILDLNGHKLTSNSNTVITNKGTLKIIDSAGGGSIEREAGDVGDLTCIMNESTGVLSMDSGTIYTKVTSGDGISIGIYNKGHITKISGGDVKAQTKGSRFAYGLKNEGKIDDISDGWFYGAGLADYQNTNNSLAVNNESGTVNISGGIFIGTTRTAGNGYGIRSAGTANISGGTFYAVNAQAFQVAVAVKDNGAINYLNGTSLTENADGARTVVGNGEYFITFVDETEAPIATYLMDKDRNIVKRMGHVQDSYNVYVKNKTEEITEAELSKYGSNTILYTDTGDRREVMMFLGSSVTYGSSSYGNSFADYLGDAYGDEVIIRKRAVSGTTLVNEDAGSYVARMKSQINPNAKVDHLIVQLSTNDAGRDYLSMGEVKNDEFSSSQMNDREIIGAMEYIIAYAKETWGCKVTFWSGPKNGNSRYDEMRDALVNKIQPKWSKYGMGVLDFYTLWKPESGDIEGDNVHPKKQGYLKMVPIAYQYFKDFDAKVVSDCINEIGDVTEEGCSGERIAQARYLYDNMLESAKDNVSNYQTLLDAEEKYASYFEGTREIKNDTEVTVLSGPAGGTYENYAELLDGKITTKSGTGNYTETPYIWKVSSPVAVKYYKLTTANDSFTWKGRNPRDWKLYGSNDCDENGNGTWTEIASVSGDTYLEDENYYEAVYKVDNPQRYSYYKWELPNENVGFLQMAEFTMYEDVNVAPLESEEEEYTVAFNSRGGSVVPNQTVKIGETVTQPTAPTRDGYIFKGWYLGETEYNFETEVTSDITLSAKWELKEGSAGGNEEPSDGEQKDDETTDKPNEGQNTPTDKPNEGQNTPTDKPNEGQNTPTDKPNEGQNTPTDKPNGDQNTPTDKPNEGQNTPTDKPNEGQNTPTDKPNEGQNTPTDKPNGDQNTPTDKPNGDQNTTTENPNGDQNATTGQPTENPTTTETNDSTAVDTITELLTSNKTDKDTKDSTYAGLTLSVKQVKKNSIKIKWKKVAGADGYLVFANECGKQLLLQTDITSGTSTTWNHTGLKKGTYYKYVVVAYKNVNNKKVAVSTSKTIYVPTTGSNYTDIKSIKVNKTSVTLKKNKTFKLKVDEVKKEKSKKIKGYRKISYESTNTKIATVSKSGKIQAKSKGKCYIYVYAQNGTYKKIKVTVK